MLYPMNRLLNFAGMTIGDWIGWTLGGVVSIFTAFVLSMVGTGLGLYYTQRAVKHLLP